MNRAQSIITQYDNYSTTAGNLNGALTSGENIADNGGVKEAYMVRLWYLDLLKLFAQGVQRFGSGLDSEEKALAQKSILGTAQIMSCALRFEDQKRSNLLE